MRSLLPCRTLMPPPDSPLELRQMPHHRSGTNPADPIDTPAEDMLAAESGQATMEQLEILQAPLLVRIDWLIHGFSTRKGGRSMIYSQSPTGGELNLGFTNSDDASTVVANRKDFLEALTGNPGFPLVTLRQVHSSTVVQVEAPPAAASTSGFAEADGMMTDQPGILLGIQTADCIPVLVADRKRRAVAGFHAGWRGTVKRIVEQGLERMRSEFRSSPEDLVAVIGPGIGACCYEVGNEVEDEFMVQCPYAAELFLRVGSAELNTKKHPHLDLVEANRRQLLGAGLDLEAIAVVQQCTSCNTDRFFSYRAERGTTGRMLSVIGIRPC